MELKTRGIYIRPTRNRKGFRSNYFGFDYQKFLIEKQYHFFFKDLIEEKQYNVLLVLSAYNPLYKSALGENVYNYRVQECIDLVSENSLLQRKSYFEILALVTLEHLIEQEKKLYEIPLLFRFSSFIFISRDIELRELSIIYNKFGFYSNVNFNRWKSIAAMQIFYDGEHTVGNIDIKLIGNTPEIDLK